MITMAVLALAAWTADLGDGRYQNPVLFADYSDPDAIRVGKDFYLTASSFPCVPGLPILHSRDLVNWTIINHVFAEQPPVEHFSTVRHGQGVWAPAIRHHDGKFWIFYPDPDFGLYVTTADDPAGKWSPPLLIKAGKGLIDPCPFWDDDGRAYLIHGWARSRSGITNLLTLNQLSPDGTRVLDEGVTIIDGAKIPGWKTIEGPKLYKRHGYYYVFAPAGGVTNGYQAVFRAKNIYGPYEHRIVLDQGRTAINGPHQGAWVDTARGEDWFLHFQDRGPFGRVLHLQPMVWRDDWPVMGADPDGDGKGEPVLTHRKPDVGGKNPVAVPATSDEFSAGQLGLQWQWNANPRPEWASLTARPGFLHLASAGGAANLYDAPNLLLQKFSAPAFSATTALRFAPAGEGERAGLIVFGYSYAWIGLRRTAEGMQLVLVENERADRAGAGERVVVELADERLAGPIFLRVTVDEAARCQFAYSFDNAAFVPVGGSFQATEARWIGAKVGLFSSAAPDASKTGYADFDWFRLTPPLNPVPNSPP